MKTFKGQKVSVAVIGCALVCASLTGCRTEDASDSERNRAGASAVTSAVSAAIIDLGDVPAAPVFKAVPARTEKPRAATDNSTLTTMFDGYGNSTTNRRFHDGRFLKSLVVKRSAHGEVTATIYARNGAIVFAAPELAEKIADLSETEIARRARIEAGEVENEFAALLVKPKESVIIPPTISAAPKVAPALVLNEEAREDENAAPALQTAPPDTTAPNESKEQP